MGEQVLVARPDDLLTHQLQFKRRSLPPTPEQINVPPGIVRSPKIDSTRVVRLSV